MGSVNQLNFTMAVAASLFLGVASIVSAQEAPPEVRNLFPSGQSKPGRELVSEKSLSKDQRDFQKNGVDQTRKGYRKVEVSAKYLEHLSTADLRKAESYRHDHSVRIEGHTLQARVKESGKRHSYMFAQRSEPDAMLTVWRFKEDGATIVAVGENFNQIIRNEPVILSLAANKNSLKCLWNVTMLTEDTQFEVTIADTLAPNGEPTKSVKQVLAVADQMIQFGMNQEENQN